MTQRILHRIKNEYKQCIYNKTYLFSFFGSLLFLLATLYINFAAGTFATRYASNPVTDVILSNTRVYDLDNIFIYGTAVFIFLIAGLCLYFPKKIPYILKTIALFTLTRSVFISLTHLGPFPTRLIVEPSIFLSRFTFGGDLFFSGHTGLPYLMALIFWDKFYLRILFIALSIIFGITVLLAHLHYTIDVFAAFFITYSIYRMSVVLFKKDHAFHKTN